MNPRSGRAPIHIRLVAFFSWFSALNALLLLGGFVGSLMDGPADWSLAQRAVLFGVVSALCAELARLYRLPTTSTSKDIDGR